MSEEAKKDEHGCIIDRETWDEDSKTCVPIEETTSPPAASEAAKAIAKSVLEKIQRDYILMPRQTTEKLSTEPHDGFIQTLVAINKEWQEQTLAKMKEENERFHDQALDGLKQETIDTYRRGLGIDPDPVMHKSEMVAMIRKMALEKAETGKRTPGPETPAGPDGNVQLSEVDRMFAKAKKGELA